MFGLLTLHLLLPGCASLKEKRGRIQPLIHRLQREFNVSVAEMALQDKWQESVITCGMVGVDSEKRYILIARLIYLFCV